MMRGRIASARTRSRRGSTFVEGALVLTVAIFTLIGIVDVGQVLVLHQGLVERVRAGARYGVVNSYDADKIRNVVVYNAPAPAEGAKPLMNLATSMVTTTLANPGTPEARIEVRIVNYPFRFFTPLVRGLYSARPIVISMPAEGLGAAR